MNNWATPNARDTHNPSTEDSARSQRKREQGWTVDLNEQAAWWNVADTEHAIGGGNLMPTPKHTGGIDLEGAAEIWPTPAARDYRSEAGGGGHDEALQPPRGSVTASDDRALFPPGPADRERWAEIIAERPDLAPAVEYEVRRVADGVPRGMGFARADQLRGLGNAVCPIQGALALIVLLERAGR